LNTANLSEITGILQASISPVALISGVGLLLLTLTNRFGRTTDRARTLHAKIHEEQSHAAPADEARDLETEIRILFRRSTILRGSISLAATSILCAGLLIATLFLAYLFGAVVQDAVAVLFALSFFSLVASAVLLIEDVSLSLKALRLELRAHLNDGPGPPGLP